MIDEDTESVRGLKIIMIFLCYNFFGCGAYNMVINVDTESNLIKVFDKKTDRT